MNQSELTVLFLDNNIYVRDIFYHTIHKHRLDVLLLMPARQVLDNEDT
jgi:hypothetical protein